jgi:hypothetical protein
VFSFGSGSISAFAHVPPGGVVLVLALSLVAVVRVLQGRNQIAKELKVQRHNILRSQI